MLTKVLLSLVAAAVLAAVAFFVIRWVRKKERAARLATATRTESEIKGEAGEVLDKERKRSDQEALEKWKENCGEKP